ncbi:alanine racemase [Fundicoccus culcitae]|uniref:Alanine racemase n=1 Tax=Fundicoccus culcitae TaxID=2969821 RepID=A0ABY5P3C7_9LACT|nr:alanine racemase [Fundicoccus culcitae]UUX33227.1 alanine racemase [Fundicoccus culcitae]
MIEPSEHRPTQVIIDLEAIRHNLKTVLAMKSPSQRLYATVKANAYGHGDIAIAQIALETGVDGLMVATVDEGISLRKQGLVDMPILVLGLTDPRGIAEILLYQLTITVSSADFFEQAYQQLEKHQLLHLLKQYPLNFHLAIDTGMGRIGLRTQAEIEAFVEAMDNYTWAHWEGVFTHFSTAGGGPEDYVDFQWQQWLHLLEVVPEDIEFKHYANSAMGIWYPNQPESDIIRLGIAMYGMDPKDQIPLDQVDPSQLQDANLLTIADSPFKPALQLVSELVYVKQVPANSKISYGAKYTTTQDEWIGTVPIGYADGWLRHYQVIDVLVQSQACPVAGVINMDQMMIRLPQQFPVGTTVTLIGRDGHLNNHPSLLAQKLNTISYEIFCSLGQRLPRVYLNETPNK